MTELFKNTHDALIFAFRYSSQQYALSPLAKMMKSGTGSGKGLVSLDGAAQSGIIMARLSKMPELQRACIVARYALRFEECPCCSSKDKMTDVYREAVATLTEWAIGECTGMTLRNMRGAIVRSFFERGVSIAAAAKELNVAKATAYDQKARIFTSLKILDARAQAAADERLASLSSPDSEIACTGLCSPV